MANRKLTVAEKFYIEHHMFRTPEELAEELPGLSAKRILKIMAEISVQDDEPLDPTTFQPETSTVETINTLPDGLIYKTAGNKSGVTVMTETGSQRGDIKTNKGNKSLPNTRLIK